MYALVDVTRQIGAFLVILVVSFKTYAVEELHYEWLFHETISGYQKITYHEPDQFEVIFSYSDRGRGPSISAVYKTTPTGQLKYFHAEGHSYLGAPVNESFKFTSQRVVWQSSIEAGSRPISLDQFYWPATNVPENYALLIRFLLKQPDYRATLLPQGEVTTTYVTSIDLEHLDEQKRVHLYAIYGLSIDPTYVWLDDNLQLFAKIHDWDGLVRAHWTSMIETMRKAQDNANLEYFKEIQQQASRTLSNRVTITNVNVFDSIKGELKANQRVSLLNGRIESVMPENGVAVTEGEVIDGMNKTLMPGLWDMHTHLSSANTGLLNIAMGITSVRDMGNNHDFVYGLKTDFESHRLTGPNVHLAGFLDKRSPFSAPTGRLVSTLKEALKTVDWYDDKGYRMLKIYSSVDPKWLPVLAQNAHAKGMRVAGHIPSFMLAQEAIEAGFDEITHMNMLFLNFISDKSLDSRTIKRITHLANNGLNLDVESQEVKQFLSMMAKRGIVLDPTMNIFENILTNLPGEMSPTYREYAPNMPIAYVRNWRKSKLKITPANRSTYAQTYENMLKMLKLAYDMGVPLVPGTDNLEGFGLHRELTIYVQAGIPTNKVLQIATIESAKVAGQDGETGSISRGKKAELILVDGNPLEDISILKRVRWVIKDKYLYSPAELHRAIGVKPFT